jgi:hypothetical protein
MTNTTTRDAIALADRVSAGIDFRDREHPYWDREVDLRKLDLGDCMRCVLGQLYGEFADGAELLDLGTSDAIRLGFELGGDDGDYDELTGLWVAAIRARREAVNR